MEVQYREINTSDVAYPQVWELRDAVLRRPLGQSLQNDDTSKDHLERIFIAEDSEGKVVGCVMLRPLSNRGYKMRQMAVLPKMQKTGVGRNLIKAAESAAWESGAPFIELNARTVVLPFYEKLGYVVEREEFTEVGISHRFMRKLRS
jgi:predicted N-acetyltransferase YhbS